MFKRITLVALAALVAGSVVMADGRGPVNGILRALGFVAVPSSGTSGSLTIYEDPANGGQSVQFIVPSLTSDQVCTATDAGYTGANCQLGGGVSDIVMLTTNSKLSASPLAADSRLDLDDKFYEYPDGASVFDYSAADGSVTVSSAGTYKITAFVSADSDQGATTDCAGWNIEVNGTAVGNGVVLGQYAVAALVTGAGIRDREVYAPMAVVIQDLSASDVVALETPATVPCGTGSTWPDIQIFADGAMLTIEKIR